MVAGALLVLGLSHHLGGVVVDQMTHFDLSSQAAPIAWPYVEAEEEVDKENARYQAIQWDWRFAQPWAHWRIFRHRVAGLGEEFSARSLFYLDSEAVLTPAHPRDRGFQHLAWVDLRTRLGGAVWPVLLGCAVLVAAGAALGIRGKDPTLR